MNILEAVQALQDGHEVVHTATGEQIYLANGGVSNPWGFLKVSLDLLKDGAFKVKCKPGKKWRWRMRKYNADYMISAGYYATAEEATADFAPWATAVQPILDTEIEE
jgi:hypothetical protein